MAETHPHLVQSWHSTKNLPATPSNTSAGSNKKFWWVCDKGHEWEAVAASRKAGTGCPFCSNIRLLSGFNDLATTNPELVASWHPTKNLPDFAEKVFAGSGQKYWWICEKGHEWQSTAGSRKAGTGCPICRNLVVLSGYNDLATTNPELVASWHPTKNLPATPQTVIAGSSTKRWWICEQGHEYSANPHNRTLGKGCPVCVGKKVIAGTNDLATTNPELVASWHPTKNLPATPQTVIAGSSTKRWWICEQGHEWETSVSHRAGRGTGCPVCSNTRILSSYNDLATTNPELVASWHPTKNLPATPQTVTAGSSTKRWWICEQGHEWEAASQTRTKGIGCPFCSGRSVLLGYNDLATTNPELVASWHPTKNLPATVLTVSAGTPHKYWWICPEGHEWETAPANRSKRGTGCPSCANYGYDATKPAILYFIENRKLLARKIGIMNVTSGRLDNFRQNGWEVIATWERETGGVVRDFETALLRWLRQDLNLPAHLSAEDMGRHGGQSETFSIDGPTNAEVLFMIEATVQRLSPK